MPESKSRHPHKHPQQHNDPLHTHTKFQKSRNAIIVAVLFFALLGLGISFFINGTSVTGLMAGFVTGGVVGFLFGYQIHNKLSKK